MVAEVDGEGAVVVGTGFGRSQQGMFVALIETDLGGARRPGGIVKTERLPARFGGSAIRRKRPRGTGRDECEV